MTALSPLLIEEAVRAALKEDLGHGHDITGASLIPSDAEMSATLNAREEGILAGLTIGLSAFMQIDPDCEIEVYKYDGDLLASGDTIAKINGPARAILTAERICLNFMSHLSGIATLTARYVQEVDGTDAQIACTRKTLPGLRAFQKYAVRCGGGMNHRHGLDDGILIKDNHIALHGSVAQALETAKANAGHMVKIEIEVDTPEQLDEMLAHGSADIVMLDNFSLEDMRKAVEKIRKEDSKMVIEASGGVSLETVQGIAKTGVDIISVGALTHSVKALDIGLDYGV